jgi:hypothetical protein
MQSTKGTARHFIVLSVVPTAGNAGELQRFEYVEGDKFKTRKAALRHADTARMRWADNYAQYRDASFALTDTSEIERPTPAPLARRINERTTFKTNAHAIRDEHDREVTLLESEAHVAAAQKRRG